jgi:hypothetical protein
MQYTPIVWHVWTKRVCQLREKPPTESQHKVRTKYSHCSSCMGIFMGDIACWCMKYFEYIYWSTVTNSPRIYCNVTCLRENDSTAHGDCDTYCVAGEHMCITNLFLSNNKNTKFSLKLLPVGWGFWLLACGISGSLLDFGGYINWVVFLLGSGTESWFI